VSNSCRWLCEFLDSSLLAATALPIASNVLLDVHFCTRLAQLFVSRSLTCTHARSIRGSMISDFDDFDARCRDHPSPLPPLGIHSARSVDFRVCVPTLISASCSARVFEKLSSFAPISVSNTYWIYCAVPPPFNSSRLQLFLQSAFRAMLERGSSRRFFIVIFLSLSLSLSLFSSIPAASLTDTT